MCPILTQGLLLARFARSFPWAIFHGPWQWGGLKIPNLYTEQLIAHIHTILKFGNNLEEITGSLLQASWEVLQLETGLAGKPTTFPEAIYDYVIPTWLSHTWAACQQGNIQIIGYEAPFAPQWTNDMELMRVFIKQIYRKNDLKCLNQCRMYIQSIYLSNICMATRDALEKFGWHSLVKKTS